MGSDGNQTPEGQTPQGQTPQGQTPQGQTPQGQTPQGQTPQGWSQPGGGASSGPYPAPYEPPPQTPTQNPSGPPPGFGQQLPPQAGSPWPQQPAYQPQPIADQPYGMAPQQPGAYGYEPVSYGYGNAPAPTDGMAIASLVLGIVSFVCFGPLASLPGLIIGIVSKNKIAASNGRLVGRGLAIAGIVLSSINLAFLAIYVVVLIVAGAASA